MSQSFGHISRPGEPLCSLESFQALHPESPTTAETLIRTPEGDYEPLTASLVMAHMRSGGAPTACTTSDSSSPKDP